MVLLPWATTTSLPLGVCYDTRGVSSSHLQQHPAPPSAQTCTDRLLRDDPIPATAHGRLLPTLKLVLLMPLNFANVSK